MERNEAAGADNAINPTGSNRGNLKNLDRLAQIYSFIFHPFFMPLIGVAVILFGKTFMAILPTPMKGYIVGAVAMTTMLFPALSIGLLKKLKVISNLSLTTRSDRIFPLVIVAVGYLLCAWMLADYMVIQLLHRVLYAAVAVILICFTINFYWKISLHMTAAGALVALLLCINLKGYGQMLPSLLAALLLSGLLGSARLYLGRHNGWQILAGFLLGLVVMTVTVCLF